MLTTEKLNEGLANANPKCGMCWEPVDTLHGVKIAQKWYHKSCEGKRNLEKCDWCKQSIQSIQSRWISNRSTNAQSFHYPDCYGRYKEHLDSTKNASKPPIQDQVPIQAVPPSDYAQMIDDIEYFRQKLFGALSVPEHLMGSGTDIVVYINGRGYVVPTHTCTREELGSCVGFNVVDTDTVVWPTSDCKPCNERRDQDAENHCLRVSKALQPEKTYQRSNLYSPHQESLAISTSYENTAVTPAPIAPAPTACSNGVGAAEMADQERAEKFKRDAIGKQLVRYNPCYEGEPPPEPESKKGGMWYSPEPEPEPENTEDNLSPDERLKHDLEEIDRKYAPMIAEAKQRLRRLQERHTTPADKPDKPSGWQRVREVAANVIAAMVGSGTVVGICHYYNWL